MTEGIDRRYGGFHGILREHGISMAVILLSVAGLLSTTSFSGAASPIPSPSGHRVMTASPWKPPVFVKEDFNRYWNRMIQDMFDPQRAGMDRHPDPLPVPVPAAGDLYTFALNVGLPIAEGPWSFRSIRSSSPPVNMPVLSDQEIQSLLKPGPGAAQEEAQKRQRIEVLRKKLLESQNDIKVLKELGDLFHDLGDYEAELEVAGKLLDNLSADKVEGLCRLAEIYRLLHLHEKTEEYLKRCQKEAPGNSRAGVIRATLYFESGNIREAEQEFTRLLQDRTVKSASIPIGMAALQMVKGAMVEVDAYLARAIEVIASDDADNKRAQSQWYHIKGLITFSSREYKKAASYLYQAITIDPKNVRAWNNLALMMLISKQSHHAERMFQEALKRDPRSHEALNGLGLCALLRSNTPSAMEHFQKAIVTNPGDYYAYYALSSVWMKNNRLDEAINHAEEALRREFKFKPLLMDSALIMMNRGRTREAEFLLRKASGGRAGDTVATGMMASLYLTVQRYDDARRLLHSLPPNAVKDALVLNCLGYLEYTRGSDPMANRLRQAEKLFQQTLLAVPDDTYALSAIASIRATLAEKVWSDDFNRVDSDTIGQEWIEQEVHGINIVIEDGRAVFSGVQKDADQGITALERMIPARPLSTLELVLISRKTRDVDYGIRIDMHPDAGGGGRSLFLYINRQNRLMFGVAQNMSQLEEGYGVPGASFEQNRIHIKVQRIVVEDTSRFYVHVNGKNIWEIRPGGTTADSYRLSIFGRAAPGIPYTFAVDNVRIIENTP